MIVRPDLQRESPYSTGFGISILGPTWPVTSPSQFYIALPILTVRVI